jgi:hypothetical protein
MVFPFVSSVMMVPAVTVLEMNRAVVLSPRARRRLLMDL